MTDDIDIDNTMANPINYTSALVMIDSEQLPVEIQDGVIEIARNYPYKNFTTADAMGDSDYNSVWTVSFLNDPELQAGQLAVSADHSINSDSNQEPRLDIMVRYHRRIEAFRGLGRILGAARQNSDGLAIPSLLNFTERAQLDTRGVMIDCSRNGVLKPESVYFFLRNMALMGLNMLQLYTEDTYEIENEPFFGYLRGKYTAKELSAIDDYAYDLDIEVIPCIQTLGHLGQILQWPQYAHLRDNSEVLLAEYEPTYEFLDKLITAATAPFRSKRIHLGMDEAYGVGDGRYRQYFGHKEGTRIFVDHLQRVNEICDRLQVEPMIWSDMLFCLAAKNNSLQGYYDTDSNPANLPEVVDKIPPNVELIFWDYYHTNADLYEEKLQHHRDLGCQQPWMATGVWTWSRFWAALPFTFESVRASTVTAKNQQTGVRNGFITVWGDDGNECDMYSSLPALLYYAQHCYTDQDEVDIVLLKRNFEGICGAGFDDWIMASKVDTTPSGSHVITRSNFAANTSKWLLWEDPMMAFLSPQYAGENLEEHYETIANDLGMAMDAYDKPLNCRLELPARLARVLSLKCHLRERLQDAYRKGRHDEIQSLAEGRLQQLRQEVDDLWRYHRRMWMNMYKPFGWENIDLRYGGLRARLDTMQQQLLEYVEWVKQNGAEDAVIPEYDVDLECIYVGSNTNLLLDYTRACTPSR
ncbi:hypothetical protein INT44_005898 [Umbelopsis vinacea]|uniref:beta-N-acetylhexosaminidase n=1 Tax=Umbelopsis vinacea TaxID=44442 RepID=A0A8H7UIG1_9FUNG|nr:hypothetical protein INT44_005898 [Umbelopsis vinacea]